MAEVSNIESTDNVKLEISSPYVSAILNPSQDKLDELVNSSSKIILDIGCGERPRLSYELSSSDLWIGCDPLISEKGGSILVHKGETPVEPNTKLIVYPYAVENIPNIKPDVIMSVAPNPKDICDGEIFNDDLKHLLHTKNKQYFIFALDNRTIEASGYKKEAKYKALSWLRSNNFSPLSKSQVLDRFQANSGDLEAENTPMIFVRNLK